MKRYYAVTDTNEPVSSMLKSESIPGMSSGLFAPKKSVPPVPLAKAEIDLN